MEHLTKQQIVLLTLFTSFVTSIATGIVTVALMDQAPVGVTGTIDHVIEKTVEEITPGSQSASVSDVVSGNVSLSSSNVSDQIANATAVAEKSLVRIEQDGMVTGLGTIVASSGIVVADKSTITNFGNYVGVLYDGTQYPLQILQTQNNGDIAFLLLGQPVATNATSTKKFTPATLASLSGNLSPRLGETVITLSGVDSTSVSEGIVSKIVEGNGAGNTSASSTISSFETNISDNITTIGSPLFDASGNMLGIKTLSLQGNKTNNFYPIGYLSTVIPSL